MPKFLQFTQRSTTYVPAGAQAGPKQEAGVPPAAMAPLASAQRARAGRAYGPQFIAGGLPAACGNLRYAVRPPEPATRPAPMRLTPAQATRIALGAVTAIGLAAVVIGLVMTPLAPLVLVAVGVGLLLVVAGVAAAVTRARLAAAEAGHRAYG